VGQAAYMGEVKNTYKTFVSKPELKKLKGTRQY